MEKQNKEISELLNVNGLSYDWKYDDLMRGHYVVLIKNDSVICKGDFFDGVYLNDINYIMSEVYLLLKLNGYT